MRLSTRKGVHMKQRFILVSAMIVALTGLAACDAFNDHPEEFQMLGDVSLVPTEEGEGGGGATEAPAEPLPVCAPTAGVTVSAAETPSITANSGWAADGATTATAAGAKTVTMALVGRDATLSFTVQETGDKTYAVCNVTYTKMEATAVKHAGHAETPEAETALAAGYEVVSGTVVVDQLSVASPDGKVVNAGSYQFTVRPAAAVEATKAMSVLLGSTPEAAAAEDGSVMVQGTYYTEAVEQAAEAAK